MLEDNEKAELASARAALDGTGPLWPSTYDSDYTMRNWSGGQTIAEGIHVGLDGG